MKKLLIFLAALSALAQRPDYIYGIRNKPTVDVREYGAKCDGSANDTTAFTAALAVATSAKGELTVPSGVCMLDPDTITVGANVYVKGAGLDATYLKPRSAGTTFIAWNPASTVSGIADLTIDASAYPLTTNAILTTDVIGGYLERVKVQYGVNGLRLGANTKYSHFRNLYINYQTNAAFLSDTNTTGENYFDDIFIGGGVMPTGFKVTRTTGTDIGGYYMRRVVVSGNSDMTNAFLFSSTVANTPFIIFMESCVGDQTNGDALKLVNAQNINVTNSWLVAVGTSANSIYLDAGSIVTVSNCLNCSAVTGASLYLANSPQTIRFFANTIDVSTTDSVFNIPSGSQPLDLQFSGNKAFGLVLVPSGAETRLILAQDTYPNIVSPIWVSSYASGNPSSAFNIYDPVNNKNKFLRNSNGTLQVVNDASSSVIWTMDDGGNVIQTGAFTLRSLTAGQLPSTANGGMFFCSDCNKATPCTGGGTGAIAKRLNGAWDCN